MREGDITHEVIAVVVVIVVSHSYLKLIMTDFSGCLQEILGQKLSLLVEIVASALISH